MQTAPESSWRARLVAALLVAALAVVVAVAGPRELATRALALASAPGPGAIALLAAVYLAGTVLLVPAPIVHVAAGFVLGPVGGALLAIPASTAGSCAAFALGRWLVRAQALRLAARGPAVATLGSAMGARGVRVVLLLRLAPFAPFTLLNYALGATSVRLRDFAAASLVGSVPGLLLDVYVGSVAASADELLTGGLGARDAATLAASAALTGVVVVAVGWLLRRTLARAEAAVLEADP